MGKIFEKPGEGRKDRNPEGSASLVLRPPGGGLAEAVRFMNTVIEFLEDLGLILMEEYPPP
jgi:hypothetical protein